MGFVAANSRLVRRFPGGMVRSTASPECQVINVGVDVDGLTTCPKAALGRFAPDPDAFAPVLDEAATLAAHRSVESPT